MRATAHLEYTRGHPGKAPAAVPRSASRHSVSKKRGMVHSRWSTEHRVGVVSARPKCEKRQKKIHAPKLLPVKDSSFSAGATAHTFLTSSLLCTTYGVWSITSHLLVRNLPLPFCLSLPLGLGHIWALVHVGQVRHGARPLVFPRRHFGPCACNCLVPSFSVSSASLQNGSQVVQVAPSFLAESFVFVFVFVFSF